jgi:hypothetical protein
VAPPSTPAPAAPSPVKKKCEPAAESPASQPIETAVVESEDDDDSPPETGFVLNAGNVGETWRRAIEAIPGMTGDYARKFNRLEISGINRLTVFYSPEHAFLRTACQRPEQVLRFEQALKDVAGQTIRVEFKLLEVSPLAAAAERQARPAISPHQRLLEVAGHPLVRRASELFGAQPATVEEDEEPAK